MGDDPANNGQNSHVVRVQRQSLISVRIEVLPVLFLVISLDEPGIYGFVVPARRIFLQEIVAGLDPVVRSSVSRIEESLVGGFLPRINLWSRRWRVLVCLRRVGRRGSWRWGAFQAGGRTLRETDRGNPQIDCDGQQHNGKSDSDQSKPRCPCAFPQLRSGAHYLG